MGKLITNRAAGCWVDVFDAEDMRGNSTRLHGPADYPGLRIRGREWGVTIESLNVGPTAYVQCFAHDRFDETVVWLLPGQTVERAAELDLPADVDSMRLFDRPPFAHEPGYGAYMMWAANHVARRGTGPRG